MQQRPVVKATQIVANPTTASVRQANVQPSVNVQNAPARSVPRSTSLSVVVMEKLTPMIVRLVLLASPSNLRANAPRLLAAVPTKIARPPNSAPRPRVSAPQKVPAKSNLPPAPRSTSLSVVVMEKPTPTPVKPQPRV